MFTVINLGLRFVLEIILLFSLGYWGFHAVQGVWLSIILGLGLPLLTAVIWGMIISPKASIKLPIGGVLLIEAVLFAAGVLALIDSGFRVSAYLFGIAALVNRCIMIRWKMQP
ncbi:MULTISPECIES: YrdB family protein [Paenibacillus]|uniref:YrdB family protein n=1 Tax=Paenibacillus TaxID=44249 RepID=UPI00048A908A|nr:YrdB family protein [Paenibacillus sp. IHBB 10380]